MSTRGLVIVVAVLSVLAIPTASAKEYAHPENHFRLTVPDHWTQLTLGGVDVAFTAPTPWEGFSANLNVVSVAADARETEAWLLSMATAARDGVIQAFPGATSVQSPRSFATGSGRPAADYILDYTLYDTPLRVRQVLFASDGWDRAYVLTFTAHRADYANHNDVWEGSVDSFSIDPAGSSLLVPVGIGALVGAIAGGALYVRHRRKKARVPIPPVMGDVPGTPPLPPSVPPFGQGPPPPPPPPMGP